MSNQVWQWQSLSRTRTNNNNTWYDVYKHSCLNVDEHKQHSHQQHYKQTKRISYWTSWRQLRKNLEQTSMYDNHQPTRHNHKAASNDTIVHSWDKWEHYSNKSQQNTTSHSVYNIQSYHGLWDTQHGYSTGMPFTMMGRQATKEDGKRITKHHYAKWPKQYNTWFPQQGHYQRWNQDSSKESGLEETQWQENQ